MMNRFLLFGASIFIVAATPDAARAESAADEWQFQLTPYIWLPTLDGTLNFEPPPGGGDYRRRWRGTAAGAR